MSIASVKNDILSKESVINAFTPLAPTISSYNILVDAVIINDTAIDTAGGQTIQINGTSFAQGAIITLDGSTVTTAYVSPNKLTFTAPVKTAGTYAIYVVNLDGGTAIYIPGLVYSGTPVWTSAAGSLGSIYETNSISTTAFTTTGDAPITYALYSGTLPVGSSLNTDTGVITGTAPVDSGSTVYSFTIKATDAQLQDSLQSFSLTINTDTVTWSSPANNSTTTLSQNTASTTALSASSAAGKSITYTSDTLPTGLSISGASVTGSPTVLGSTTSLFTATAATSGRTATRTINWTITVANDVYFMYDSLLLSGGTSTSTFIADESVNNFALTIAGDTKPNNFNPYTPGYYSNYFDGTGDYLSVAAGNAALAFGTGDFTVEFWVYPVVFGSVSNSAPTMVAIHDGANNTGWQLYLTDGSIGIRTHYSNVMYLTASMASYLGVWTHIAYVRSSGTQKIYMNGVEKVSTSTVWNWTDTTLKIASQAQDFNGYFSNVRLVKGTALYTSAFTPPTAPLTAISGTSVLTCQSNRFIDNSTNAFTIIVAGNTKVDPKTPFVPNTQYAAYGSTYFDGTGDYLYTPQNAAFSFGTGDFTVEGWYYLTAIVTDQALLMLGTGANGAGPIYCGWWLKYSSYGALTFYRYDGTETTYSFSTTLVVNTWYHIACSRSGTSLRMFLNGTQLGATATSSISFNNANSDPLQIGKCITGQGTFYYNGYVSNVRIVKGTAVYTSNFTPSTTPLTAVTGTSLLTCQTNQPVNNSVFLDNSTNALAITSAGNATQGTFSPYGANWSNYFDGTGDYLSSTLTAIGTNDFTVEYYSYLISHSGSNEESGYFQISGVNGGISTSYLVGVCAARASPGNGRVLVIYIGSSTILTTYVLPLNTWFHTAIVRQSNVVKVYINGTLVSTPATISTNLTGAYYAIGGIYSSSYLMNGYISNFRVISNTAIYTATFTTSTSPLTPISGTSVLTCQSNQIIDNSINNSTITKNGDVSVQRFSPFGPQTQTANTHSAYFSTKTDFISVPATAALTTFTGDFTFECWVNPTDTSISTTWGIWDSRNSGQTASAMIFFLTGLASPVTGQWRLSYYNSGSQYYGTGVVYANQWTHVAFVRSGSTLTYYVNGVAGGTTSVGAGTISGSATSNPVYIGTKDGSLAGYGNVGYISNFRVVKGVAVYTGNFTVPTSPLAATQAAGTNITAITGTQTSLLTLQSSTFVDNSSNNFVITAGGTTKPRTLNPFGFTNTLAAYSAATYGASAYFDGSGDYLSVPSSSSSSFGTGNFTVECWVYMTANSSYRMLLGNGTSYLCIVDGALNAYYSGVSISSSATVALNTWTHVAFVRSAGTMYFYINGALSNSTAFAGTWGTTGVSTIGYSLAYSGLYYYTGYISNFRIVNGTAVYTSNFVPPAAPLTAITNTSLLLNMNSAGIYDSASMNDLETVADAKILATQTPYAGSYYSNYFDGTGDYLLTPSSSQFNLTGDFTIECWIYKNNPLVDGNGIFGIGTTDPDSSLVRISAGVLQFWLGGSNGAGPGTGTKTGIISCATAISSYTWYHVALVRSGSSANNVKLYLNGVLDGQGTGTYQVPTGYFVIGRDYPTYSIEYFPGYISNLRVVHGTAVYTSTFTPSTTPLTAIANTRLLTCQSNRFVDNSTNAFAITKYDNTSVQSFNPFQRNSATTMYFDGTGDYLTAPYNPAFNFGTGNFTIEFWVNTASTAAYATALRLGDTWTTGSWALYLNDSGGSGIPSWWSYTLNTALSTSGATINDGAWHHIALVRNSTTMTMYIDGTSRGTLAVSTSSVGDTTTKLWIARDSSNVRELAGYINDLRITKGIARYTTTFTPSTTAFLTY